MDTQIIRCAGCGGSIRVPRNMGRLRVVCPLCKSEFLFNSDFTAAYNNPNYDTPDQATPGPTAPGPTAPGPAAPGPVKTPSKKGGGGRGILAFLAVLLVIFVVASSLGNTEKPSTPSIPTLSLNPPTTTISPVSTAEIPSASALPAGSQTPAAGDTPAPQISAYERASELIPYFELRYFLSQLDDAELDVICTLYESAMNFEESCTFEKRVEASKFIQLFRLLAVECPELFQIDFESGYTYYTDRTTQEVTGCDLPYLIDSQSRYKEMRSACENVINSFVRSTSGLSNYEKEKYVFDYIASNCWYNVDAAYADIAYGALISFEAKCDGFSDAMKWSLEALGIQCLNIWGDPADGGTGHAWNIVNLDGSYYLVDVTISVHDDWMKEGGIDHIIYRALNVTDAINSKYAVRDFFSAFAPIPACNSMDASYYARTGHFVPAGANYSEVLSRELKNLAASGSGFICIQFEQAEDYAAVCNGAGDQVLRTWLDNYGKPWSYTWWYMDYNVFLVKVTW